MKTVYITETSSFMPGEPIGNDRVEEVLGKIVNQPARVKLFVLQNNGIKQRYYALNQQTRERTHTNAQLTAEAVRLLCKQLDMPLSEVKGLVCGSSSPDQMMPSHSNMTAGELGLGPCEVVSTAGVCASGMTALKYAYMNIAMGIWDNFVATGSERASAFMQNKIFEGMTAGINPGEAQPMVSFEKEFLRWMLSDGAGAAMLEPEPRPGRLNLRFDKFLVRNWSGETPVCMYNGINKDKDGNWTYWTDEPDVFDIIRKGYLMLQQDVRALDAHMVRVGVEGMVYMRDEMGVNFEEIDWFLPHLSSMLFKDRLDQGMRAAGLIVEQDKWFTNLSYKGNVGSASIYIILDELMKSGNVKKGQKIFLAVPESGRFTIAGALLTVV
jgi:3-oxoacyl-[acyl-carrier-protein] synthase-3